MRLHQNNGKFFVNEISSLPFTYHQWVVATNARHEHFKRAAARSFPPRIKLLLFDSTHTIPYLYRRAPSIKSHCLPPPTRSSSWWLVFCSPHLWSTGSVLGQCSLWLCQCNVLNDGPVVLYRSLIPKECILWMVMLLKLELWTIVLSDSTCQLKFYNNGWV